MKTEQTEHHSIIEDENVYYLLEDGMAEYYLHLKGNLEIVYADYGTEYLEIINIEGLDEESIIRNEIREIKFELLDVV